MANERAPLAPLIRLKEGKRRPVRRKLVRLAGGSLEKVLRIDKVRAAYDSLPPAEDPKEFVHEALKRLQISYSVDDTEVASVPSEGPVIVVSNHPFGGIDGMILAAVLSSVRPDVKILANYMLGAISDMRPLFLLVDPFGKKGAAERNIASIGKTVRWVKQGGMLVVFPAGEVSHLFLRKARIEDPPWNPMVARLVRLTRAPVLPVYFRGSNSFFFQMAGLVHPKLRTALLPREVMRKRTTEIRMKIGAPIPYRKLSCMEDPEALTRYLRFRTYLLRKAFEKHRVIGTRRNGSRFRERRPAPIVPPPDKTLVTREVESLSGAQRLLSSGEFDVYCARLEQIPVTLREIARLRETTFRATGEGTGKPMDFDGFDETYLHLFVWNREKEHVVGAYRLGATDEIVPRYGKEGLYTHTLFRYGHRLLKEMGPALEMGRTFIREEYQKSYSPLMLLWKGIGAYVASMPGYRTLFGAVSITSDYRAYSRQLIVRFFESMAGENPLSRMVKPRKPFKRDLISTLLREKTEIGQDDIEELSSWIAGIEQDGKGIPILLKQYLKLGGTVLAFNVDPLFGNALDGFIVVDLLVTEPKILKRYMGRQGYGGLYRLSHEQGFPKERRLGRLQAGGFALVQPTIRRAK